MPVSGTNSHIGTVPFIFIKQYVLGQISRVEIVMTAYIHAQMVEQTAVNLMLIFSGVVAQHLVVVDVVKDNQSINNKELRGFKNEQEI